MRIFKEEQRFTQTWLIALLGISVMLPMILIVKEYFTENSKMTTNEFVFSLLGITVSVLFIFIFKLTTRIDEKGIHYRFFPFHRATKTILWSEINSISVRNYDPISEYGGWGLKGGFSRKRGKAINVSGDIGIQLELKTTKKLLIGTQKEVDAKKVIHTYQHKILTDEN